MQEPNEQLELTYLQMYVLNVLIDKELLQEVEGDVSDKVGEVLRVFNFAKKVSKNKAVRNIGRAIISEAPGAIENLSKKVKNKKLKAILNSDIAKTGVDLATGYTLDKLQ